MSLALNHMVMPTRRFAAFAAAAGALGITDVEIRNDLPGVEIDDGTPPAVLRAQAEQAGVRILAINALQRFEDWSETRAAEAAFLVEYAQSSGAEALVLCPTNDRADPRSNETRAIALQTALSRLAPLLRRTGVRGLVEPLGFPECALRTKRAALDAIDQTQTADVFAVLHDTFHHYLAGETDLFPERTGLVHVSGVDNHDLPVGDIRDEHRVLVGPGDRLGTLAQVQALRRGGYEGAVSLEPFAPGVDDMSGLRRCLAALGGI